MSRLGKRPIELPSGVKVTVAGGTVTVAGKGGSLKGPVSPLVRLDASEKSVTVTSAGETKRHRATHGLTWALIKNMVEGVTKGFKKELEIVGVGWNAKMQGTKLVLQIGFCHTVDFSIPEGVKVALPKPQNLEITGIDKQRVGQFAAEIRAVRPPEPYKGKGIRYKDEHVERKTGKSQVGK
jgi:large subunit ribosomal protein L6